MICPFSDLLVDEKNCVYAIPGVSNNFICGDIEINCGNSDAWCRAIIEKVAK